MKKISFAVAAAIVCSAFFSCAEKSNGTESSVGNFSAQQLSDIAYTKQKVSVPENMSQLLICRPFNGGERFLVVGYGKDGVTFCTADRELQNAEKLDMPSFVTSEMYDMTITESGTICQLSCETKEDGSSRLMYYTYNLSGDRLSFAEMDDFGETVSESTSVHELVSDGKTLFVCIGVKYFAFTTSGKFLGELKSDMPGATLKKYGLNADGELVCAVKDESGKLCLCRYDAEKCRIADPYAVYDLDDSLSGELVSGRGDHKLYITTMKAIYGVRADGSLDTLFSFKESGVNPNNMCGFSVCENGDLIIAENDINSFSVKMRRYTAVSASELSDLPILRIGVDSTSDTGVYLAEMSEAVSDYRLEFADYDFNHGYGYLDDIRADIIAGSAPDILCTNGLEYMHLAEKGAFTDLYKLMDGDTELSRGMFNEHILSELESDDGCLYELPNAFSLGFQVGKSKFLRPMKGKSLTEMLKSFPDSMDRIHRETYSNYWTKFVDIMNGTVNIDRADYGDYLEYTKTLPSIFDLPFDENYQPSEAEQAEKYYNQQMAFRLDKQLLYNCGCLNFYRYFEMKYGVFGGEEIEFYGTPTLEFRKKFAITEQCSDKALAWKLLKNLYSESFYEHGRFYGEPVIQTLLEKSVAEAMTDEPDDPEKGYEFSMNSPNNEGIDYYEQIYMGFPTQDDRDEYMELLNSAEYKSARLPDKLYEIVEEEESRFYAGECTAEQCMDVLESRMRIYLSEQN